MAGKAYIPGINSVARKVLLATAEETKAQAIVITEDELQKHTGLYLDSFHIEIDGPLSVSVRNTAQYAYILEEGQKPHRIPLAGYAGLKFIWNNPPAGAPAPSDPPYHHFAYVNHPGAKAYQILKRAMIRAVR